MEEDFKELQNIQKQTKKDERRRASIFFKARFDKKEFNDRMGSNTQVEWQNDKESKHCTICDYKFTLVKRRHHCRGCGRIVCANCSSNSMVVNGQLKRACQHCYAATMDAARPVELGFQSTAPKNIAIRRGSARMEAMNMNMNNRSSLQLPSPSGVHNSNKRASITTRSSTSMRNTIDDLEDLDTIASSAISKELVNKVFPNFLESLMILHKSTNNNGSITANVSATTNVSSAGILSQNDDSNIKIEAICPRSSLDPSLLRDIIAHAFPPVTSESAEELKFMFRIRDKSHTSNKVDADHHDEDDNNNRGSKRMSMNGKQSMKVDGSSDAFNKSDSDISLDSEFLNCYVSFHKNPEIGMDSSSSSDSTSDIMHAIVFVTEWPFADLAFRILARIDETLLAIHRTGAGHEAARHLIEVAYAEVAGWQVNLQTKEVPFLGESLQMRLSPRICNLSQPEISLCLTKAVDAINVVSFFHRAGLLNHIWTLWELVITGKDIVIISSTPRQSSEFVIALSSLVDPLLYAGDLRPYFVSNDSDANLISMACRRRRARHYRANIRNNNNVSSSYRRLSSATSSPSKTPTSRQSKMLSTSPIHPTEATNANHRNGTNPADHYFGTIVGICDMKFLEHFKYFDAVLYINAPSISESKAATFRVANPDESVILNKFPSHANYTVIISKIDPAIVADKNLLGRLKKMNTRDFVVLGDNLVRDNLRFLTAQYVKTVGSKNISEYRSTLLKASESAQERRNNRQTLTESLAVSPVDEAIDWTLNFPQWCGKNIPTIIMWTLLIIAYRLYIFMQFPVSLLVIVLYLVDIPSKAPPIFESMMKLFIPEDTIYLLQSSIVSTEIKGNTELKLSKKTVNQGRKRKEFKIKMTADASTIDDSDSDNESNDEDMHHHISNDASYKAQDLSGVWKRINTQNYGNFLKAQGTSAMARMFALKINMIHTITMDTGLTKMRLQQQGGPLDTDDMYTIDSAAEPVETIYLKKKFSDRCEWQGGELVMFKEHESKEYTIEMRRWLSEDAQILHATAIYRPKDGSPEVRSGMQFEKINESPNPRPGSTINAGKEVDDIRESTGEILSKNAPNSLVGIPENFADFSGKWLRTKSENYEGWVGAQGGGYLQRKLAASVRMTHTIHMSGDGRAMSLKEQAGPINTNFILHNGAEPQNVELQGKTFKQSMFYRDNALVIRREHIKGDHVLEFVRTLESNSSGAHSTLVLRVSYEELPSGKRTEASAFFSYMGLPDSPKPESIALSTVTKKGSGLDAIFGSVGEETKGIDEDNNTTGDDHQDAISERRKFNGKWQRVSTQNFEQFVAVQGAGIVARKIAAAIKIVNIITLDDDLKTLRFQEKGGGIETDFNLIIGAEEWTPIVINKKKFRQKVDWSGSALQITRRHVDESYEIILTRFLSIKENGEKEIRLTSIHRDLFTKHETESTALFQPFDLPKQ